MPRNEDLIDMLYCLSHDVVTLMWIATFQLLTAGLHQAMVLTGHISLYVAPWLFVLSAFRSLWLLMIGGLLMVLRIRVGIYIVLFFEMSCNHGNRGCCYLS